MGKPFKNLNNSYARSRMYIALWQHMFQKPHWDWLSGHPLMPQFVT